MTNNGKNFELIVYICVIVVLTTIYFACFNVSQKGYGYPGYRGYHHHHHYSSWFYMRNYDESYYPSNRENSVNGNRFSQRGLSGGK